MDIYNQIYDITNKNLKDAGMEFDFSKNTYLFLNRLHSESVDLLELEEYENDDFVQIAYLSLLQRPIDEPAHANYRAQMHLPKKEFRAMVLNSLLHSQEFLNTHMEVYNNIYLNETSRNVVVVAPTGVAVPQKIMKIYRHLPGGLKKLAKKIAGAP